MEHRYVLAQSENYQVSHEFEVVFLARLATPKPDIVIGDFYGDPTVAVIDAKERFVIMAGCGIIIYYLAEPFEPYHDDTQTGQWAELFREPESQRWIESITQTDENTFYFTVDPHSDESGTYELTFPNLAIQKLQ